MEEYGKAAHDSLSPDNNASGRTGDAPAVAGSISAGGLLPPLLLEALENLHRNIEDTLTGSFK